MLSGHHPLSAREGFVRPLCILFGKMLNLCSFRLCWESDTVSPLLRLRQAG